MRRSHGFRSKTRDKLKGGRFSIAEALQTFDLGAGVQIRINPAVHNGMPHPRYQGRSGKILEHRGRSYMISIKDGRGVKQLLCRPEHLRKRNQIKEVAKPKTAVAKPKTAVAKPKIEEKK